MIGYIRFFLSLVVMAAHAGAIHIVYAKAAVFGFYGISGYFGTMAVCTRYKGDGLNFFLSRYIRIWPTYAAVFFATSLMLLFWMPVDPHLRIPALGEWIKQLFLFNIPEGLATNGLIVPPAGMLPIMLFWWAAIALGVSRDLNTTMGWLAASLVLFIDQTSYFSVLVGSLPFAVGSLIYHLGLSFERDSRIPAVLGELSYPIFIGHYAVKVLFENIYNFPQGWSLFFASILPTLALSWLLVALIERPVDRFRKTLRS